LELNPSNHFLWHNDSVLLLQLGDVQGYRRDCREMLARFGQSSAPNVAERTAKTCLLAPGGVDDYGPVVRIAERALKGTEKHGDYKWFLLARGMADYRTAQYPGAIDWFRKSLSPGAEVPYRDGLAYLFLAMAQRQLGRADDARQALAKAHEMAQRFPKLEGGNQTSWPDWLRFHVVRREAEKVIVQKSAQ